MAPSLETSTPMPDIARDVTFKLHSELFCGRAQPYERHSHVLRTEVVTGSGQSLPNVVVLKLHDDDALFRMEETFYQRFRLNRIPKFYGSTLVDKKLSLILSCINGTPLDDLDDSYLERLDDLYTMVLELMRSLRDAGAVLEDYAPRNFILDGSNLWVVDFEAWVTVQTAQKRWPDDDKLEELLQTRAESTIEQVKDLLESRIKNKQFNARLWAQYCNTTSSERE